LVKSLKGLGLERIQETDGGRWLRPSVFLPFSSYPTMGISHLNHRSKNVIPSLLVAHYCVREHTPIPTDMVEGFGEFSIFITQPMACILHDIQFAVRVSSQAMASCFVVGTRTEYSSIILGHMKINGIGTKCGSQF